MPDVVDSSRAPQSRQVVRGSIRDYARRSPEPADVALVAEVSDSSLGEDRKQALLYARAGIPIYWTVNLVDRQVEVYTDPSPAGYQARQDYHDGDSITLTIGGCQPETIAVNDILP